jgi:hypothetical protein
MIRSAGNWFKRNRTNFAIAAGAIGTGYLAGQYALNKLTETRQRMSEERIAKEKYVQIEGSLKSSANVWNEASVDDLSRIRRIAHSPSSLYYRQLPRTSSKPYRLSRYWTSSRSRKQSD